MTIAEATMFSSTPAAHEELTRLVSNEDATIAHIGRSLRPVEVKGAIAFPYRPTTVGRVTKTDKRLNQLVHVLEALRCEISRSATKIEIADEMGLWVQDFSTALAGSIVEWEGRAQSAVLEQRSEGFVAFKELGRWLDASDAEVAEMVGIGRTTPYSWMRQGHEPQAAKVRRLYQAHSVVGALVKRLGEEGLRRWLAVENPERRERLFAGDLAFVQREAHDLLFKRSRRRVPAGAWMPDEDEDE